MAEAEKGDRLPAAERKRLKKEPDGEGRMAKRVTKRYKKPKTCGKRVANSRDATTWKGQK